MGRSTLLPADEFGGYGQVERFVDAGERLLLTGQSLLQLLGTEFGELRLQVLHATHHVRVHLPCNNKRGMARVNTLNQHLITQGRKVEAEAFQQMT